jgi:hypothetical protein
MHDALDIITKLYNTGCANAEATNNANWEYLAVLEAEAEAERERQAMLQSINDQFDDEPTPMNTCDDAEYYQQQSQRANAAHEFDDEDDWSSYRPAPKAQLSKAEQQARAALLFQTNAKPSKASSSSKAGARTRPGLTVQQQLENASQWAAAQNLVVDGARVQPFNGVLNAGAGVLVAAHNDALGASQMVRDATSQAQLNQVRATQHSIAQLNSLPRAKAAATKK